MMKKERKNTKKIPHYHSVATEQAIALRHHSVPQIARKYSDIRKKDKGKEKEKKTRTERRQEEHENDDEEVEMRARSPTTTRKPTKRWRSEEARQRVEKKKRKSRLMYERRCNLSLPRTDPSAPPFPERRR